MANSQNNQQPQSYLEKVLQELVQNGYAGYGAPRGDYSAAIKTQIAAKDPKYAAGAALASVLKGLKLTPQDWARNYAERGALKKDLQNELSAKWGDNAASMIEDLKNQGIWDNYRKLSEYNRLQQAPQSTNAQPQPQQSTASVTSETPVNTAPNKTQGFDIPLFQQKQTAWDNWLEQAKNKAVPLNTDGIRKYLYTGDDSLLQKVVNENRWREVAEPFQALLRR